jgi:hypothetical protein
MPSSSLSRVAASSKRAAAASQGFFSLASDMAAGEVRAATVSSLRFYYASKKLSAIGFQRSAQAES